MGLLRWGGAYTVIPTGAKRSGGISFASRPRRDPSASLGMTEGVGARAPALTPGIAGRPIAVVGEADRFFRRANQRARLQHALLVLGLEVGIGHHADAGLPVHGVVLHEARAH